MVANQQNMQNMQKIAQSSSRGGKTTTTTGSVAGTQSHAFGQNKTTINNGPSDMSLSAFSRNQPTQDAKRQELTSNGA